jgi:hypothetical protein
VGGEGDLGAPSDFLELVLKENTFYIENKFYRGGGPQRSFGFP